LLCGDAGAGYDGDQQAGAEEFGEQGSGCGRHGGHLDLSVIAQSILTQ
jgi:hypothetical protein